MYKLTNKEKAMLTFKEIETRKDNKRIKEKHKEQDLIGYERNKYYNRYIKNR